MIAFDKQNILATARKVFADEIVGINKVASHIDESFINAIYLLCECSGKIVVTGIGKSGHIANKIAATFASTGAPSFYVHPAEALHGDIGMISNNDTVIAISYSGESDELAVLLPILSKKNIKIIGLTGNIKSSLAKLSDVCLNVNVGKEACPHNLAPTTSTTATLVLGDALAVSLLTIRGFKIEDFALSHPGGSLGRKLLTLVDDIMYTGSKIPFIKQDAPFKDVVYSISKGGLGFVVVIDEDYKLLGIIVDGDVRRAFDKYSDLFSINACDMMIRNPKTIRKGELATKALELLENYKITSMVVIDENDVVVGVFNMHDLFKAKLIV